MEQEAKWQKQQDDDNHPSNIIETWYRHDSDIIQTSFRHIQTSLAALSALSTRANEAVLTPARARAEALAPVPMIGWEYLTRNNIFKIMQSLKQEFKNNKFGHVFNVSRRVRNMHKYFTNWTHKCGNKW